ncbi:MAG: tetratricopeptide repeat protein, partial [Myxococcaceae bacterium]
MAERNETLVQKPSGVSHPALGGPERTTGIHSITGGTKLELEARDRIAALDREARAVGTEPGTAALLFHEMGLLFEDPLKNPRAAAVAYQNAYRLAPRFLANLRAARRLFADVGNWQMVIQLIDAELAATHDDASRAALIFEKGHCLQTRLSREEEAFKVYRLALELKPVDVGLLQQLEGVYLEHEDHAAVVEVDRLLANTLEDPSLRAHYLTSAGLLTEDRLRRPQEAAQLYREAFALDRRDPLLLSAVMRIAQREERPEELLQALVAEADILGDQAAPTYLRISKVYAQLGRQEDALAALLAARRVSPDEALVLSELASIYETEGRHEDLADVLSSWASALTDAREKVSIHL